MSNIKRNNIDVAPLRTLDDFFLDSARFQIPDFKQPDKWGNRVVKNLLYYQTNYFLLYIVLFIIFGVIHPKEVSTGVVACILITVLYLGFTNNANTFESFRNEHRNVMIILVVVALYLIYSMLNSVLVLMVALLFPMSVIFIHASLRLRNLRNKLTNQVEILEIKVTPMGLFLKQIGLYNEIPKISPSKKIANEISENLKKL